MPQVITNLDLKKNEIQNVVLQPLSTPPSDPKIGQKYFNTNDKNEYRWNGTAWVTYQAPLSTTTASTISIPNGIVKGDGSTLTAATAGTDYQAPLPSQTGNSGKYLTTNGSALSWASPPSAPVTSVNTKTGDVVLTAADVGAATSSDISAAINALDGSITGTAGAGKTLTAFSQTNGKVTATFGDIVFPVTSVNTKTGAVSLTASDVGALPDTTEIPTATSDLTNDSNFVSDASYVHTDNNFTTTLKNKLDGIAAGATVDDHKWNDVTLNKSLLASVGEIYVPYLSSTTATSSSLTSATPTPTAYQIAKYNNNAFLSSTTPAADDSSTKVATTAFVSNAISSLGSVLDFKGTKETTSQLPATGNKTGDVWIITTDSSEYVWTGTAWEKFGPTIDLSGYVPTSRTVNGKALSTDISLTATDVGAATPSQIPTITVSQTLTSGEEVGTITIDGTTTTLYAPEDTDTKVNQTKVTYSSYTYWRAIPFGTYNASTPIAALSATNTTDREYTVDNLRFWPQNGWIRTHAFNPAPNAAGTTNSYNQMTSDSVNNIYFRVNATGTGDAAGDTVMTLYSNGTDMQVRPGGQYDDKVDLGKPTVRWKDLYLSGTIYNSPSSTTVASGDKILVNDTSAGTISSGITLGSSTTQYLANNGSWQNIPTVPTNCEVLIVHVASTWATDITYATMNTAYTSGGVVYFRYGEQTAIASYSSGTGFTANMIYIDSGVLYQKTFNMNSSDELTVTETSYTFPTIYNGETS